MNVLKERTIPAARKGLSRNAKENIELYLIMLPTILLIIIFMYIPLYGVVIAFQDYVPGAPFFGPGTHWVGLKHFQDFISSYYFTRIVKTLWSST